MMRDSVGLVGVGLLGSAIAERLIAAEFDVLAYDLDPSRIDGCGAKVASRLAELGACRRVVLCLPDNAVVDQVLAADSELFSEARPAFVVDTTTGDPTRARAVAAELSARGIAYVDACVSGSSAQMRAGSAILLVGGEDDQVDAVRDLLSALAGVQFHLGGVGSGLELKLVSNLLLGLERFALAESLHVAERLGLPTAAVLEVLRASPAYCPSMDTKGPKMLAGDYEPQARLAQHRKDVKLILEQAKAAGAEVPMSRAHKKLLDAAVDLGLGDRDNSAVFELLRRLSDDAAGS